MWGLVLCSCAAGAAGPGPCPLRVLVIWDRGRCSRDVLLQPGKVSQTGVERAETRPCGVPLFSWWCNVVLGGAGVERRWGLLRR